MKKMFLLLLMGIVSSQDIYSMDRVKNFFASCLGCCQSGVEMCEKHPIATPLATAVCCAGCACVMHAPLATGTMDPCTHDLCWYGPRVCILANGCCVTSCCKSDQILVFCAGCIAKKIEKLKRQMV